MGAHTAIVTRIPTYGRGVSWLLATRNQPATIRTRAIHARAPRIAAENSPPLHQLLNEPVHQDHLGHGEVGRRPRAMTCPGVEEEDEIDNVQYHSQYEHDDLLATSHCSQFHPCTLGTAVRRTLQM